MFYFSQLPNIVTPTNHVGIQDFQICCEQCLYVFSLVCFMKKNSLMLPILEWNFFCFFNFCHLLCMLPQSWVSQLFEFLKSFQHTFSCSFSKCNKSFSITHDVSFQNEEKVKEGDTRRGGVLLTLLLTWIMACENFMEQEKSNMNFFSFQIPFDNCSIEETKEKRKSRKKKKHNPWAKHGRVGLALLLVMVAYLPTFFALDTQNCWLSQILRYVALFMLAYTFSCPTKPSHFLILIFHLCIPLDKFLYYWWNQW
jgi:hypothetical protein